MFLKSFSLVVFLFITINRHEGAPEHWILYSYAKTGVLCFMVEFRYFCPSISDSSVKDLLSQSCINGQTHSFHSLKQSGITPDDLLRWIIPYHIVEQYAGYLTETNLSMHDHLTICNCTSKRIGMYCEYTGVDKSSTVKALLVKHITGQPFRDDEIPSSFIDDIECQLGGLGLQWRQICNGIVDCEDGIDEFNCDLLESHHCNPDEFQCRNGLCISPEFAFDGMFDCLDSSDEQEIPERISLYESCFTRNDPICEDRFCQKDEFSCGDGQCVKWTTLINLQAGCKNLRHIAYRCDTINDGTIRKYFSRGTCNQTTFPLSLTQSIDHFNCIFGIQQVLLCNSQQKLEAMANMTLSNLKQCPDLIEYPLIPVISPVLHIFYNKSALINLIQRKVFVARKFPPQPYLICLNGSVVCHGLRMSLREPYCMSYDQFLNLTFYPFLPLHSLFCEKAFEQQAQHINHSEIRNKNLIQSGYICMNTFDKIPLRKLNNGYFDCLYRDDEKNDQYPVTEPYRYRCQTVSPVFQYVSFQQLGNGIKECDDGSDEIALGLNWLLLQCKFYFTYACWVFKAHGVLENRIQDVAIHFDRHCNSFWDTMDGEDEKNCTEWICPRNMRQCNRTGQCIDVKYIGDGEFDCSDGEDELNFSPLASRWELESTCNTSNEHFCITFDYLQNRSANRPCIPFTIAGDGIIDCIGGRDERNTMFCPDHTMLGDRFICDNRTKCINYRAICDGIHDCLDHTDEIVCFWNRSFCPSYTFSCGDLLSGCKMARCMSGESCTDKSDRFWCPRVPNELSYRPGKLSNSSSYEFVCSQTFRPDPKALTSVSRSDVRNEVISLGYCNRGFYLTMSDSGLRVCFCPPSFYGNRCQYESRRINVRYRFDRRHRADIPMVIVVLTLLIYNRSQIIDYKIATDVVEAYSTKTNEHLRYPRPRPRGLYSIRIETYASTDFLAAWEYPVSPFDFLPLFRIAKLLRFPDRTLPWFCFYNLCRNGGTCYMMNDNQQLCLCKRGWQGQFCENRIEQTIKCAPHAFVRDHDICICPYGYMNSFCFVRNSGCDSQNQCPNSKQSKCYSFSTQPVNRFRCVCLLENCDGKVPIIFLNRELPNPYPFLLQFLELSWSAYPIVWSQILLYSSTQFPTKRHIDRAFYTAENRNMPQIGLLFMFQPQLRTVARTLHILLVNCSNKTLNYTVNLDKDPLSCSFLNEREGNLVKRYHSFCQRSPTNSCFYSRRYLCFCNGPTSNRSECIPYVQQNIDCDYCLNEGYCVQGDLHNKSNFACVCPRCASGQLCQFSPSRFSISLELLFEKTTWIYFHFIGATVFALLGFVSNSLCSMTFFRPKSRQTGTGIYLLINSVISQSLLTLLLTRVIYLYLSRRLAISTTIDLALCRSLPLLMSVFNYISLWLMTSVTIERALAGSFPTRFAYLRTQKSAVIITIIIVVVTGASIYLHMDQYKLVKHTGSLYSWCINEIKEERAFLIRFTTLFHQIAPFVINLFAGMTIIVAISRSKSVLHHKKKRVAFMQQIRERMNLLVGPTVCFITQLPQLVVIFIDACIYDQKPWFISLTLLTYYLSFVPQISLFLMYVIPSPLFKQVFTTQTTIGQRIITVLHSGN